ncbi:SWF or SNF family helicase [Streptomyces sp. NPDC046887]|uniref:SWF or SNF family helicase n=1 Tax=Streptomyces sp. NPDC046887 TaxID=3155472 RepID=UPI0033CBD1DC
MSDGYEADLSLTEEYGTGGAEVSEERTFAALPPAPGGAFARSWWGQAWLKALEDSALDLQQVKRGRRLARAGAVGAVSVRPGRITAVVRDRDGTALRSDVLLRELDGEEWDRFLAVAAERAGHVAALLEREMPPHLVEDAATVGVELLPGIGDLEAECACGAWDHCPHTVALCQVLARLLDEDPFVLLLLRGRGERRLLAEVQARVPAGPEAPEDREGVPGVRADEAFAARDILPALPPEPVLPEVPGRALSLAVESSPGHGVDPAALEALAADAAGRAYRLLAEALSPGHGERPPAEVLTVRQDAVRLLAEAREPLPEAVSARLAAGSGRRREELTAAVAAWRSGGGVDALRLLEEEWAPTPEESAAAQERLASAWQDADRPPPRPAGPGRWSVPGGRLGVDGAGRWWALREVDGHWIPAGLPDADPAAASALLAETEG